MEFLNPGFLFGLFAIAIPVIIHLFNFRRFRKVYFTNVKFIEELKQETQKQSRLRHLLILFMRILVIAALVFAFAKPFIPVTKINKDLNALSLISVYVDNSFSMQAESSGGILLDEAKMKALDIASVYKSSDLFQLLTNDFEGRHQRFVSKDEFMDLIEDVKISPVVKTFSDIVTRQEQLFSKYTNAKQTSYFISDFQKSNIGNFQESKDSSLVQYLIPLTSVNSNNLYIDSCWFESPVQQIGQHVKLQVRIKNSSDIDYEKIPVKLLVNGTQKALASIDISNNSSAEVELPFTNNQSGIQKAVINISDFPISFDDQFYFSWKVVPIVKVLCINQSETNVFINAVLGNDSAFSFRNNAVSQIDYSSLGQYPFIILNALNSISTGLASEIKNFVENGGSVLVLPAEKPDIKSYNSLLNSMNCNTYGEMDTSNLRISYINLEHSLYYGVFDELPENIDLPTVFKRFQIKKRTRARQEVLLQLRDGSAFLTVLNEGIGRVYLSAVPFDPGFSNFPHHAIFVPTVYQMAVSSVLSDDLYYTIGEQKLISVPNVGISGDDVLRIKQNSSDFEFIPGQLRVNGHIELNMQNQISDAGNYFLTYSEKNIRALAFNYNRDESEMVFYTPDELNEMIQNTDLKSTYILDAESKFFSKTVSELNQGVQLWRWCLIFALIFLAIEVLLLRSRK